MMPYTGPSEGLRRHGNGMSTGRRGQQLQPQKQLADKELELQKHGRSVEGEAVASQQKERNYLGGDTFLCLLTSLKR